MRQVELNFEAGLTEQFPEFRDVVKASVYSCGRQFKAVAADLDMSSAELSRKLADEVRAWCLKNGPDKKLRIVLCGHAGEHDELLAHGWQIRKWAARKGYAVTEEAVANSASETLWCSPHCVPEVPVINDLFAEAA